VCVFIIVAIVMLSRDFGLYGIIIYECVCVFYNRSHGNAVKGFSALWDNIYECVCFYNRYHGNVVEGFWALRKNIYDCVYYIRFSRN
jgi:hypothetical protein